MVFALRWPKRWLGIDLQEILVRATLDAGIAEALQYRVAVR
jgi:hypothetical protein